jgi:tetratricopeptide (TPR) repeat protein
MRRVAAMIILVSVMLGAIGLGSGHSWLVILCGLSGISGIGLYFLPGGGRRLAAEAGKKLGLAMFGIVLALVLIEILLRVAGLFVSLPQTLGNIAPADQESYRIICLGESTTAGGPTSWPGQLESILNNRSKTLRFRVYNLGWPGTNTAFILANLEGNIERYRPDMVVSMMGVNDGQLSVRYERVWGSGIVRLFKNLQLYKLASIIIINLEAGQKKAPDIRVVLSDEAASSIELDSAGIMEYGRGNYSGSAELLREAIRIDPQNKEAYIMLARTYDRTAEKEREIGVLKNLSTLFQEDFEARFAAGWRYHNMGMENEAEIEYLAALVLINESTPRYSIYQIYADFALVYLKQGKQAKYIEMFNKSLEYLSPSVSLVRPDPKETREFEAFPKRKIGFPGYSLTLNSGENSSELTRYHYNEIYRLLRENNIRYVAMQYPTLEAEELRDWLGNRSDVTFVSNRENFERGLAENGYDYYFVDNYTSTFGHATNEGNRLIAESAAEAILKVAEGGK